MLLHYISEGLVKISIKEKQYLYSIDMALIEKFKTIYRKSNFKALNFLKKHCKWWEEI